jgi:hypothetical protein
MGGRADLTTVPPLRAPQLAGTRQALDRTQRIAVDLDGRVAALPRPDLLGALVVKACAAAGDHVRGPQRHLEELARRYRLVADPAGNRRALSSPNSLSSRRTMRRRVRRPRCGFLPARIRETRRGTGPHHRVARGRPRCPRWRRRRSPASVKRSRSVLTVTSVSGLASEVTSSGRKPSSSTTTASMPRVRRRAAHRARRGIRTSLALLAAARSREPDEVSAVSMGPVRVSGWGWCAYRRAVRPAAAPSPGHGVTTPFGANACWNCDGSK